MKTSATFSNGETTTYGGTRKVTAAWAIIDTTTNEIVEKGYSLNIKLAASSASSNISSRIGGLICSGNSIQAHRVNMDTAKRKGWNGKGQAKRFLKGLNVDTRIEYDKTHKIEVVSL